MILRTTKHGYNIYSPNVYNNLPRLFCRDEENALEDIREILLNGETIEVVNDYETFYGCSWGDWLIKGTADIADNEVTASFNPGEYCEQPFAKRIKLTPKAHIKQQSTNSTLF